MGYLSSFFLQSYCDDPDLVLELKNLIVIFADTLQVGSTLYIEHSHRIVTSKCAVKEDSLSFCVLYRVMASK